MRLYRYRYVKMHFDILLDSTMKQADVYHIFKFSKQHIFKDRIYLICPRYQFSLIIGQEYLYLIFQYLFKDFKQTK